MGQTKSKDEVGEAERDEEEMKRMVAISGTVVGLFAGHTGLVSQIAVNEVRGDVFATGSHDKTVRVWRIGEESPLAILTGAAYGVTSVGWSEDGRRLVSGSDDGEVRVHEERRGVAEWQLGWMIVIGSRVYGVATGVEWPWQRKLRE